MAQVTFRNSQLQLEVQDREFVVLAGPRGCGSSAIVRAIAGLDETSAEISIGERSLKGIAPKDRDVAFVSQDYVPYPGLSVYENIASALRPGKFAAVERKKRVESVAGILGLQGLLDRMPDALSAEECQWVALARAMVRQPKVFLFDQPFLNLDRDAAQRGRAELKKLQQRLPATIIYGTHDPVDAVAMGDRLLVLDGGILQQEGSPSAVYHTPENLFVAGFVGFPPMNLIRGTLKQDRGTVMFSEEGDGTIKIGLPKDRFPRAQELAGSQVVLGVRPEEISLAPAGAERSQTGFRALVETIETSGAEAHMYLQTGAHVLVCRSPIAGAQREAGHRVQLEINLARAHLFDPESGRRINPGT